MKKSLLSTILFLTCFIAFSQVKQLEKEQEPGKGNVSNLSWLEGFWTGTGFGGECEEVWMPAVDGSMIGTFRFWSEGKLVFSEFMHIVQEGETFSLKLKHFNADLSPWEEKEEWTTFRLVEVGENIVYFHGLTMKREGDEITLWLALTEGGVRTIEELKYVKKSF
ncbi:DUF6265 family protein [Algoriphagus aquimarinus]|uniref:DUF6265 domain-containing protein n=1 Tax=Algoriphagus aquimarinus TaxID=237018 RepID=A0A1I0YVY6_9BACT|nr:DUF6265 family protein [Algoriphagus aquimarinus]SFB17514.1 hypothetical protein SAMN04489723_10599 [Algoriphagus aquimarinus]